MLTSCSSQMHQTQISNKHCSLHVISTPKYNGCHYTYLTNMSYSHHFIGAAVSSHAIIVLFVGEVFSQVNTTKLNKYFSLIIQNLLISCNFHDYVTHRRVLLFID